VRRRSCSFRQVHPLVFLFVVAAASLTDTPAGASTPAGVVGVRLDRRATDPDLGPRRDDVSPEPSRRVVSEGPGGLS
jgi:hypothetical protein